jgi:hypothetical protein
MQCRRCAADAAKVRWASLARDPAGKRAHSDCPKVLRWSAARGPLGGRRAAGLVLGLLSAAGCAPALKPITPTSPVAGLTVQVREFDVLADPSVPDRPPQEVGASVAQRIVDALRQAGVDARWATAGPAETGLVLEGQVTHSSRGNRALRYLGGIWSDERAGAARFAVKGRALRSDGSTAGEFSASRRAGFGLFGGNGDTLLNNCIDAVADDVADMVITGQYQDHPDDTALRANALFHP